MVGGAEGRVVVYCPGQSVGERLQRIVQQPDEGGVCGPGSFRFVAGGQGFGSGIPAVLESGEVAQRDRVQNAGRIRRRTWAGLRYAPSAPSSITKPTDSHKHWYIKRGQARGVPQLDASVPADPPRSPSNSFRTFSPYSVTFLQINRATNYL